MSLVLCVVLALVSCALVVGKLAVPNIDKCVQATLNNKVGSEVASKKGRQLFIYFGDAAIEAAEVFSQDDVRRVTALAKCTAGEDSELFEDRSASMHHFHDGGSNVTYLTGLFQTIFPGLDTKIRTVAQKAIARAEWTGDMSQYGIRSVQYLSFYKAGLKAHRASIKEKHHAKKSAEAFVVFPDTESSQQAAEEKIRARKATFDPDADEVVKGYLQRAEPINAVAFTAIIQLTDRAQFAGGELLVSKTKHQRTTISLQNSKNDGEENSSQDTGSQERDEELQGGYNLDDEDHYDDPEPESDQHSDNNDNKHGTNAQDNVQSNEKYDPHAVEFPSFNAHTTSISRYTPEVGNMLLVLGEHSRGLRPVLYGRRNSLVIEYWVYADGAVGTKRPSLSEAQPRLVDKAQGEL